MFELGKEIVRTTLAVLELRSKKQIEYQDDEARQSIGGGKKVRFERTHDETYREFGFDLVSIRPGSLKERVNLIKAAIRRAS